MVSVVKMSPNAIEFLKVCLQWDVQRNESLYRLSHLSFFPPPYVAQWVVQRRNKQEYITLLSDSERCKSGRTACFAVSIVTRLRYTVHLVSDIV